MGEAQRVAELEREVAAKDEFVNVAAHQLQEPLASMKWQLDNLLAGRAGQLKPKQRSVLGDIYAINQEAIRLVKDLLMVARLEGGRLRANAEPTDVVALVRRIVKRYESAVQEYRGVMHYNTPRERLPLVVLDHRLMTQAIDNLISNALKYNPQDTHIDVSVKLKQERLVISVHNGGQPIPADAQAQLFQKFARVPARGTEKTKGTGLGLYITRQIVELHRGTIDVTSAQGKGTTFSVALPLS
ncbi:MAG: HAMP domain-containing histidine kinase [Candidatus Andersenbacteria bacterium]|nr:HAMP domain-containing histidine kinase [Candidatus Andersenbacteria bacterium]